LFYWKVRKQLIHCETLSTWTKYIYRPVAYGTDTTRFAKSLRNTIFEKLFVKYYIYILEPNLLLFCQMICYEEEKKILCERNLESWVAYCWTTIVDLYCRRKRESRETGCQEIDDTGNGNWLMENDVQMHDPAIRRVSSIHVNHL